MGSTARYISLVACLTLCSSCRLSSTSDSVKAKGANNTTGGNNGGSDDGSGSATPSGPDTTPPTLTATSPSNGLGDVGTATAIRLEFDESLAVPSALTACSLIPTAAATILYDDVSHSLNLLPTAELMAGTAYTVRCEALSDLKGNTASFEISFTTRTLRSDFSAPLTSVSPLYPTAFRPHTVTLSCSDSGTGCQKTFLTTDGSEATTSSSFVIPPHDIALTSSTTLRYFSVDNENNAEAEKRVDIAIDATAPLVTATQPTHQQVAVSSTTDVRIFFNEDMDSASVRGRCEVQGVATTEIYDEQERVLYLQPTLDLPAGTQIAVVCTQGMTDIAGNPLAVAPTFTFATAAPERVALLEAGRAPITEHELLAAANGDAVSIYYQVNRANREIYASVLNSETQSWSPPVLLATNPSTSLNFEVLRGQVALVDTGARRVAYVMHLSAGALNLSSLDLDSPQVAMNEVLQSPASIATRVGLVQRTPAELTAFSVQADTVTARRLNTATFTFDASSSNLQHPGTNLQACEAFVALSRTALLCRYAVLPVNNFRAEMWFASVDIGGVFASAERVDAPSGVSDTSNATLFTSPSHDHLLLVMGKQTGTYARTFDGAVWDPVLSSAPLNLASNGAPPLGNVASTSFRTEARGFAGPNDYGVSWPGTTGIRYRRFRSGAWQPPAEVPLSREDSSMEVCNDGDNAVFAWTPDLYDAGVNPDQIAYGFWPTAQDGIVAASTLLAPVDGLPLRQARCVVGSGGRIAIGYATEAGALMADFDTTTTTSSLFSLGADPLGISAPRCATGAADRLCVWPTHLGMGSRVQSLAGVWARDRTAFSIVEKPGAGGLTFTASHPNGDGLAMSWLQDGQTVHLYAHKFGSDHNVSRSLFDDRLRVGFFGAYSTAFTADDFLIGTNYGIFESVVARRLAGAGFDRTVVASNSTNSTSGLSVDAEGQTWVVKPGGPEIVDALPAYFVDGVQLAVPDFDSFAQNDIVAMQSFISADAEPLFFFGETSSGDFVAHVKTYAAGWQTSEEIPGVPVIGILNTNDLVAAHAKIAGKSLFTFVSDVGDVLYMERDNGVFSAVQPAFTTGSGYLTPHYLVSGANHVLAYFIDNDGLSFRLMQSRYDGSVWSAPELVAEVSTDPLTISALAQGDDFYLAYTDNGQTLVHKLSAGAATESVSVGASTLSPALIFDGAGAAVARNDNGTLKVSRELTSGWVEVDFGAIDATAAVSAAGKTVVSSLSPTGLFFTRVGE